MATEFELHFEVVTASAFYFQHMQTLAKLPNGNNLGAIALRADYRRFVSGFNKGFLRMRLIWHALLYT